MTPPHLLIKTFAPSRCAFFDTLPAIISILQNPECRHIITGQKASVNEWQLIEKRHKYLAALLAKKPTVGFEPTTG